MFTKCCGNLGGHKGEGARLGKGGCVFLRLGFYVRQ